MSPHRPSDQVSPEKAETGTPESRHKPLDVPDGSMSDQLPPPEPEPVPCLGWTQATRTDDSGPDPQPLTLGRYQIKIKLGSGGFGVVYKAYDTDLRRDVAIKVPRRRPSLAGSAEAFLTEARILASLDHPGIVPVYDVAHAEDGQCYVVSKFVEGMDLRARIKQGRPDLTESVEWVACVAEALHYAHQRGLVHRDIKPSNILLDTKGHPFVADFGLALREEDYGTGPGDAGTPVYMSPEQARGEGHLVDARTDVYSLGLVFYELLTGQRPFRAKNHSELLDQINTQEVRPPRQLNDRIPKELDRVCLKALSKRVTDRYSTALDLAEDFRHWQTGQTEKPAMNFQVVIPSVLNPPPSAAAAVRGPAEPAPEAGSVSERIPIGVIPKGLRSFEAEDADYFLDLLPGPRGRDGLPDSIRFWKYRLEETNSDKTFRVGLIYGPSGCGKSSFVKAGLLPRLAGHVLTIYLEATPGDTEARLLKGLGRRFPDLPGRSGLTAALTCLRKGQYFPAASKVLIVLDQFEQWLHAMQDKQNLELVQALRQCDGQHLQCLVLVRDDFWMAITSFMKELEVPLLENQNSVAIDLFSPRHARKVLEAFGKAFDAVAEGGPTAEQKRFLDEAVAGLAQNGKVIPVRLALFSEMVKGKAWTPATLKEVGGAKGIGVTFLEETFSAATAPPQHRLHQKAARAVLRALLPEPGASLKGQMKSHRELLEASGYSLKLTEFDELLHILDTELRLVTPTEAEGGPPAKGTVAPQESPTYSPSDKYYQLTHDYLVTSVRDWLTRKQKETRRGRAELLLADRAGGWNSRPENRQLPSLLQWLQIRWLTAEKNWTAPQRKMMAKAGRYHATRGLVVVVVLALIGWGGYETRGRLKANALRDRLLDAHTDEVPTIVQDMARYRRWLNPLLYEAQAQAEANQDSRKQLHASLALLPVDATQVNYLFDRLLDAEPYEVPVIRDALSPYKDALRPRLWAVVVSPDKDMDKQRLQAASALASYEGPADREGTGRWQNSSKMIADELLAAVQKNLSHFATLLEQLRPIRSVLAPPLIEVSRDKERPHSERSFATNILADYVADEPELLADLLLDAEAEQFPVLYPKLQEHGVAARTMLREELSKPRDLVVGANEKKRSAKRQANAALALWRLDGPASVRRLLEHSQDPTVRSYLIHRLGPFGVADEREIMRLATTEAKVTIRRALILSLGEFKGSSFLEQAALVDWLLSLYEQETDAGVHAAAGYVLETLGQHAKIEAALQKLRLTEEQIQKRYASGTGGSPLWHVNGHGQTMVVIRGPVEFVMGSPTSEICREASEVQHRVRISRTFAIGAHAVTIGEFRRLPPKQATSALLDLPPQCPVNWVSWYDAAAYCNRLSQREGIPRDQWCYDVDAKERVTRLRPKYLSLTGYRLPTEAEMEFATRADALTSRYFGESEELLAGYGWYWPNSNGDIQPVGRLRPNDFGFFDMNGNVWNWCQEKHRDYPQTERGQIIEDDEYDLDVGSEARVLRGGCYTDRAWGLRSAHRWVKEPMYGSNLIGFRVARTIAGN